MTSTHATPQRPNNDNYYSTSWLYKGDNGPFWARPSVIHSGEPTMLNQFSFNVTDDGQREQTSDWDEIQKIRVREIDHMIHLFVKDMTGAEPTPTLIKHIKSEPAGDDSTLAQTAGSITFQRLTELIDEHHLENQQTLF